MGNTARADKWLWAVRLAKTRGMAAEACASGKVKRAGVSLKAATSLRPGETLEIRFPEGPGFRTILIKALIEKRVGAPEAQACYEDLTTPEALEAQRVWHEAKRDGMKGRPTKKNRRDIDHIHGFWE